MTTEQLKPYLSWQDICKRFDCGRSKAMLLMHEVGVVYIGKRAFVKAEQLDEHLDREGAIDITWPKSTKGRY